MTTTSDTSANVRTGWTTTSDLVLPGSGHRLVRERDPDTGMLVGLVGEGVRYFGSDRCGRRTYDGLCEVHERRTGNDVVRSVTTADDSWIERYHWTATGLVDHVDGVELERDTEGRVTRCRSSLETHDWHYAYADGAVVRVDNGQWCRHLTWEAGLRRVVASRVDGDRSEFAYDTAGRRTGVGSLPSRYHRDPAGRLWVVTGPDGEVVATYLWDRYRCLGRIDGPLGSPLAAVFSLDPSGTPVRLVTVGGCRRLPRDAFGEGLLDEIGVPGLFGGVVRSGLVHLPERVLDPRTASFCAPDPFDGSGDDPRRRDGFAGPLPTETDRGGAYAVCRNDPIGRSDPTGSFTGGGGLAALIISDLTWSLQNNLLTFFGLDWVFNFLMSLVTGFQLGDFGSTSALGSSRLGSFALRRDGFVAWLTEGRAFTTQHLVWSPAEEFELLHEGRVLDPGGEFEPTLYGSQLVGRPSNGEPFMLTGMAAPGGVATGDRPKLWSRAGGPAVPAAPGAVVAKFPSGGFHLDDTSPDPEGTDAILGVRGPQDCRLVEVEPGPQLATGRFEESGRSVAMLSTSAAFTAGQLVLFADTPDNDLAFATVSYLTVTTLAVEGDVAAIGPSGVTVVAVDPTPRSSESHDLEPAVAQGLDVARTSAGYVVGDLLRATASSGEVTAARVNRTEARVPLDRPVPGTLGSPLQIRLTVPAAPVDAVVTATTEVEFAATPPSEQAALVRGSGGELPVIVSGSPSTQRRTLDADLTPIAAVGDTVTWIPLAPGAIIGTRNDPPEANPELTYTPVGAGTAPDGSGGGLVLRIDDVANVAVRLLAGPPIYDAVIADRPLAGTDPFVVERRAVAAGATPVAVLSLSAAVELVVEPNAVVPRNDAGALQLQLLVGDPPTVRDTPYAGVSATGDTLTTTQAAIGAPNEPRPGQVVIVDPAGTAELIPVRSVRIAAGLDRPVEVASDGITAVLLQRDPSGTAWPADRVAARRLVVRPEAIVLPTGNVPVQFPRFRVGETIELTQGTTTARYRVGRVDGLTLDVETDIDVPTGTSEVRQLVPVDPGTGTVLIGRDGVPTGGSPTSQIEFSVWQPDHLADGVVLGITTAAGTTVPAVVTNTIQSVTITLARPASAAGTVDVAVPDVLATAYTSRYRQDDDRWVLEGVAPAPLLSDQPSTLLVVPLLDTDRVRTCRLTGGTLLVPDDEEAEIDRHQSLVEHETRHTQQYSWFGPLWFNIFPLWLLELGVELGTDVDLPAYGPFLDGTIAPFSINSTWECTLGEAAAGLSRHDQVQVVRGGTFFEAKIESIDGAVLLLKADEDTVLPTGAVQLRKRNAHPVWDVFFSSMRATTHGGLLNLGFGNTWARLLWLIMKGIHGLHRVGVGPGELQRATVEGEDQSRLRLTDEGRAALRGASVVIVRYGEDSVVRSARLDALDTSVLVLDQGLPFNEPEVQVGTYGAHDPGTYFDWQDYYPARVPDPSNSAVIEIQPIGGDTLDLGEADRVEVHYRDSSFRTEVTSAAGATVQLARQIPVGEDEEQTLRIAKVGEQDPMSSVDGTILVEAGLGWLRYVLDPYGQIQPRAHPEGTFWDVVARIARYGLGTQSWSLMPIFGYVWYDRLFRESVSHRSYIEQDASGQSGDLYSALGRLYGSAREADGFAHRSMTVGDIARYWYWPVYRHDMQVLTTRLGSPGVHLDAADLRLLANRTPTTPNRAADSDTSVPDGARAVPDLFGIKQTPDPGIIVAGGIPDGITPSATGLIPLSPTNQRSMGCYVAWTRPGDHRAVTSDGIRSGESQDLHDRESRQTLYFDLTVDDVTVRIGGVTVNEGDTVPLVLTQAVSVQVEPGGARVYAVTVARPSDSPVLRVGDGAGLVAQTAGTGEVVEVSRWYRDGGGGYTGGLDRYGIHLGGDVHIPVRRFTVDVVDTVPMRAAADPTAAASTLTQGTPGFVLVPAGIVTALRLVSFAGRPPVAADPAVTITQFPSLPGTPAGDFVGATGAVFAVTVAAAPALAGPVPLVLEVDVGTPGAITATLTCTTEVGP